jgi:hypothetical protein
MNGSKLVDARAQAISCTRTTRLLCALALAWACGACAAASRSPDPTRPRADSPPYPVTLAADDDRRDRALATWATLAHDAGLAANATAPELQPVTATLRALPSEAAGRLRLPLVEIKNAGKENTDEATRESLRRFITSARDLLGVTHEDLSLVEIRNEANSRVAVYQQRPFRRPLRGGYGRLEIRFAPDRTVLSISSTAIPDAPRLARAFAPFRQRVMPSDREIAARIAGHAFTYTTASGATQTYTVAAGDPVNVRDLVIYPLPRATDPNTLELHLAWETVVGRAGDVLAYVDSITGEIIAATQAQRAGAG